MASMNSRNFSPEQGSVRRGVVHLYGKVTLGSSGAVSSQTGAKQAGFTVAKTAAETGRYTVTLVKSDGTTAATYSELLYVGATLVGTTDAVMTTDKGVTYFLRNSAVTTAGTFDIQFATNITDTGTETYVDANPENSAVILIHIVLSNSSI